MIFRSVINYLPLLVVSAIAAGPLYAAEPPTLQAVGSAPCEEIRAAIRGQTTVRDKPDVELLDKIAAHTECRFTSPEAFRAAFGPRLMPKHERPLYRQGEEHEDD